MTIDPTWASTQRGSRDVVRGQGAAKVLYGFRSRKERKRYQVTVREPLFATLLYVGQYVEALENALYQFRKRRAGYCGELPSS